MIFVFGMSTKEKELDFTQTIICPSCGAYGRLEAFMTYSYFSLFFIPIFKWNKKYYARSTCCGSIYAIDDELGRDIERGIKTKIEEDELRPIHTGYRQGYCSNCRLPLEPEFQYCPRCGSKV
ncbi:MAG: zinc ribbon domain-containing protein [Tissierellia bacterium]|nr:zinc ribbon domain-containing protein [Tissierellia bacterium]